MKRLSMLLLACALLMCGCLFKHEDASYTTHAILHGALDAQDLDRLAAFDYLIVGEPAFADLPEPMRARALLYINVWGASAFKHEQATGWIYWQDRPGDLGMEEAPLEWTPGRAMYCFTWGTPEEHIARMLDWTKRALALGAAGVFLDDWGIRYRLDGPDETKRRLWSGYPNQEWALRVLTEIEMEITREVFHARGRDGIVLVNGEFRYLPSTFRMAENWELSGDYWDRLEKDGVAPMSYVKAGDFLQVNALDRLGNMPSGQLGRFERAIALAQERGASVGLAYMEKPAAGGSIYQLVDGPWGDPSNWPEYKAEDRPSLTR